MGHVNFVQEPIPHADIKKWKNKMTGKIEGRHREELGTMKVPKKKKESPKAGPKAGRPAGGWSS